MTDNNAVNPGEKNSQFINLRIIQDEKEVHFRVTTGMGKLKRTYADHYGGNVSSLRFLLDGRRINDEDTPESLELEEDDVIEVFQEQHGDSHQLLRKMVFARTNKEESDFFSDIE